MFRTLSTCVCVRVYSFIPLLFLYIYPAIEFAVSTHIQYMEHKLIYEAQAIFVREQKYEYAYTAYYDFYGIFSYLENALTYLPFHDCLYKYS